MPLIAAGAFTVDGPAGRIECLLRLPAGQPRYAALVCHPHPLYGGSMHNKLTYRTAAALASAGGASLRFNFRGTGLSQGSHDGGRGEIGDARAAIAWLSATFPGQPLLVAGYSFGAWVGLQAGADDPRVVALAGLGLATTLHDFSFLLASRKPKLVVQGADDPLGPAAEVEALVARLPPPCRLRLLAGTGHSFDGQTDEAAAAVADFARQVLA